jgi:transposase-like protein
VTDRGGFDAIDTQAEATCPYCGETTTIGLDPAGGSAQDYVEDCPVCCRSWQVRVRFDERGSAKVVIEPS